MRQKVLSILLALLMVLNMFPVTALANSQSYDFVDMPNNWSTEALEKTVENGLLKGYADKGKNLIKADAPLKRAEMAAVVNRAFGVVKTAELEGVADVPSTAWYANEMAKAVMMSTFMKDINMHPERNITRQEAFVVLARAFKVSSEALEYKALENYSDNADIAAWAKKDLNAMVETGYIQGSDGKLNPNANISRAEFATVMDNLVKLYIDMPGELTDINPSGNILIRVPGVTLKNITIEGDLIIADGVSEGDVILDNVKVQGRTVIRGGGENSIIIKGSSNLGKVIVCKVDGKVRIAVESEAGVEVIYIDDGSNDVLVEGVVGTLEVAGDNITAVATKANISNAIVSGDNSTIILKDESTMKEGTITGNASKIIVDKGAAVDKITIVGSDGEVEGNGTVKNVEVKASGDNASVITPNTKIETAKEAQGVTAAGGAPVKGGTTVTNNNVGTWIVIPISSSSGGSSDMIVGAINIAITPDVTGGVNNDAMVEVTLTTMTSGAGIYYTLDGSTPATSSNIYTGPFVVDADNAEGETIIIKAIGIMAGYKNSEIKTKEILFKPASISVTAIRVSSNPAKITYYEGESLILTGFQVELTYSDNSKENVVLSDFTTKGITTDPVNGTVLTTAEHNDKRIMVSCNDKSAQSGDMLRVLVATPSEFAGGDGSEENPYQVANVEQLDNVRNYLDKHFIQTVDIDLMDYLASGGAGYNEGKGWEPIGVFVSGDTGNPFTGSYNGNNKTISNLNINRPDKDFVGLFEYSKGDIDNLTLLGVDISGKGTVGGLIGYQYGGKITDCSVSGSVKGTGSKVGGLIGQGYEVRDVIGCYSTAYIEGFNDVGGLIGHNNYSTIEKCYATGNVKGNSSTTGGLVASNYIGVITDCYATGSVYGLYDEVGGLVGWNAYSGAQIINSYATGQVTGGGSDIGGLVGENKGSAIVDKCYATGKVTGGTKVGGLIGETIEGATTTNSYWNIETSGQVTSAGGTGYPTSAMIMATNSVSIYVDWDFANTWAIDTYPASYPYMKWQGDENIPYPPSGFAGGKGTVDDPYEVATAEQLDKVRNHLDRHFILTHDIDLSEYASWVPIGNVYASQFYGSFDGNGHTISNLKITSSDGLRMFGLFGYVTDANIKNLQIKDAYVVPSSSYEQQVGILAGYTARTIISNCSTSGTVSGSATYMTAFHVGGLVGQITDGTVVDSCYSMANVTGWDGGSGLINDAQPGTTITNSYSSGTVSNGAGFVRSIFGTVENCYTIATVSYGNIFATYISDSADVEGCYYQNVAEGPVPVGSGSVTGIIGVDEVAMKNQTTFIGWDFINIWDIDPDKNGEYPFIR